jgi:hypothetical protein
MKQKLKNSCPKLNCEPASPSEIEDAGMAAIGNYAWEIREL